jgi:hypothetical protein
MLRREHIEVRNKIILRKYLCFAIFEGFQLTQVAVHWQAVLNSVFNIRVMKQACRLLIKAWERLSLH